MTPPPESDPRIRWQVYGLLITLAAGLTAGRIASVERLHEPSVHKAAGSAVPRPAWPAVRPEPSPTFSSNDRSRWAAARALVEKGTFVVGRRHLSIPQAYGPALLAGGDPLRTAVLIEAGYLARTRQDDGIIFEDGFQSIDKVLRPDTDEFYSTKPPLLTLLMAGEYWLLKNAFGWTMAVEEQSSMEEKARVVENRFHVTRVALVAFNLVPLIIYLLMLAWLAERFALSEWSRYFIVAAGGFATLVSPFLITINNHTPAVTAVALALYALVRIAEEVAPAWLYMLAGLASGFAACMELPALAFAAGVFVYLAWNYPRKVPLFVAAALVPAAAMLAANYAQFGRLKMAYAEFGGPWYEYEGSHWRVPKEAVKRGIDFARRNGESRVTYAFHLLIGHHGVFSLMPVMLLAVAGMGMSVIRWSGVASAPRGSKHGALTQPRSPELGNLLATFGLLVSAVVLAFYLYKSDNYGGWSNGPRWLMWLAPLWLVSMLPVLDALAKSRTGRLFALALLALSILSMSYQNWNPWRHPWIYNWMESRGWITY